MDAISPFEAFLIPRGQRNYRLSRRGRALLSLPLSREGALHAFDLYQPQRTLARGKTVLLRALIAGRLHPWVLKKAAPAAAPAAGGEQVAWDFDYDPGSVGILLGSSEHRIPRAIASFRGAAGWEVAKLGLGAEARRMLRQEAAMLDALADGRGHGPRCLGLHEQGEMSILRMPYLAGKPLASGESEDALELLHQWIGGAAPRAIESFEEWPAIRAALEPLPGGAEALGGLAGRMLRPVIAHGDFARWNLRRPAYGPLRVLDWEWGKMEGMPGLDLVHYFAQDARLVSRLDPQEAFLAIEDELGGWRARGYLATTGWGGDPAALILACAAYKQGARHQTDPDFLAICLKEFLASYHGTVEDPAVVIHSSPEHLSSNSHVCEPSGGDADACADPVRISVVTPSFRQLSYLKICAASVRDQAVGFRVEHLIHDGGSGDDFLRWAGSQRAARWVSEKDDGMYDAINRGFRRARGEIVAWLNCDEQYLPGTLEKVSRFFEDHPDIDILFGDVVLVDELMHPLAYRRAVMPSLGHIRYSHLSTFSAATFVRRRVLDEGHYLQTRWQTIADAVWIEELLAAGYRAATLHEPLSIFCMLGSNLGQSALLFQERREWENELGTTSPWRKRWFIAEYRMARLCAGAYRPRQVSISAYVLEASRRTRHRAWVTGQWSVAKSEAATLRLHRDGALNGMAARPWRRRWVFLHAACAIALALGLDRLEEGDAVKGPLILLGSLMLLSFRARLGDLGVVTLLYWPLSFYLLSERPPDVLFVRQGSFTVGSLLAIFWAASLRNLEAWVHGTVALIRRMPGPMILTDRRGIIVLVNHAACALLKGGEAVFVGRDLRVRKAADEGAAKVLSIPSWEERPPDVPLDLSLDHDGREPLARAGVFVVGKGRRLMYAFMLSAEDAPKEPGRAGSAAVAAGEVFAGREQATCEV